MPLDRDIVDAGGEIVFPSLIQEVLDDFGGSRERAGYAIAILDILPRRLAEESLAFFRRQIDDGLVRFEDTKIERRL